jgi:hypothetical protein
MQFGNKFSIFPSDLINHIYYRLILNRNNQRLLNISAVKKFPSYSSIFSYYIASLYSNARVQNSTSYILGVVRHLAEMTRITRNDRDL